MLQHVYERASQARYLTSTIIATDDERVYEAARGFGARVRLTRSDHISGTDRVAEIASSETAEIIVNIQGDEPLIDPAAIDAVAEAMVEDESVQIATPCSLVRQKSDIMDPNVVKVARDFDGNGLYFSRAPIPWVRDSSGSVAASHWKHIGLYGYRRDALLEYPMLPPGELERLEQLEQLRWLENGYRIRTVETDYDAVSVDVPADIARVEELIRSRGES